jgi:hypothetical protein
MCNKEEETLEHLMLQCPCFRGAREKVPIDVAELIDKAGGNQTLQTTNNSAPSTGSAQRSSLPCCRTTVNHWCNQQYEKHWNEGDTNSTNIEKVRALAEEIIVMTEDSLLIWNGVVTKA